jgi:hypothetical protein
MHSGSGRIYDKVVIGLVVPKKPGRKNSSDPLDIFGLFQDPPGNKTDRHKHDT